MKRLSILATSIIVFLASFCTLMIEIVAGRILAPHLGVSLYTWTSIIGVVLAGISLGNFLGGRLADRRASREVLGLILLVGSLSTVATLVLSELALTRVLRLGMPLVARILVLDIIIFFLPCLILGVVTPVAIKMTLDDIKRTGAVVGTVYAVSTAGSLLGVFATGFFLIEAIGTRTTILAAGSILFLTAVWAGEYWRNPARLAAVALVGLIVSGGLFISRDRFLDSKCLRESGYYCIRVLSNPIVADPTATLMLDHLTHTKISLVDPTYLSYSYIRAYADITTITVHEKPDFKSLFIGGGGYGFPRYVEEVYPESEIHVIEIDPAVTEVSYEHLGLRPDTRIISYNRDARIVLMEWDNPPVFDVIYGDAFNDLSIPYHLTTVEFHRMLYDHLSDDGVYLANVIDDYESGEMLRAFINTMGEVFPHIYLVRWGRYDPGEIETIVAVGAKRPLDLDYLDDIERSKQTFGRVLGSTAVDQEELAAYRRAGRRVILTDDYAPVEQLVARLFLQRGS